MTMPSMPHVLIAFLLVGSADGFLRPAASWTTTAPTNGFCGNGSTDATPNSHPSTALHWKPRLFGKKKGNQPVRFLSMNSGSEDGNVNGVDGNGNSQPTDVVASQYKPGNDDDESDGFIDVQLSKEAAPDFVPFQESTDYDVVVVGAGCAGVGTALMLTRTFGLDNSRVMLVEQGKSVGESFKRWPEEMRFISPSFNQMGWTTSFDLNAIHYETSPAHMLRTEHPSGDEYAIYLQMVAEQAKLNIKLETKVASVTDNNDDEGVRPGPFELEISEGGTTEKISTRYVVWAGGEFQFPKEHAKNTNHKAETPNSSSSDDDESTGSLFPGAEHCLHNSRVKSWESLPGDDFVVIGGYESGIDATVNLSKAGKNCKVLASTPCWNIKTGDPSGELAPYTAARLRDILSVKFSPNPKLLAPIEVIAVDPVEGEDGGFDVTARWKEPNENSSPSKGVAGYSGFPVEEPGEEGDVVVFRTPQAPILCTGFKGSVAAQASHLFEMPSKEQLEKGGCIGNGPLLTRNDESTSVPGVFLVGPSVTHGELSFCFVYKFRQRFGVVANAICQGLGMDTERAVAECRSTNMYLDNFASCEGSCDTC